MTDKKAGSKNEIFCRIKVTFSAPCEYETESLHDRRSFI